MIAEIMDNYKPDGLWFDGSVFTIKNCYCKVCKARFLKEKGLVPPTSASQSGWTAYKDMQRQIYREFLYKTVDRIKAKAPNCLVTINLAYSMHMPEKPYKSFDYFTADFGNELEELSQEAHWYDNQDKPFEIMTTVHLGDSDGKGRQPKPKGQIEQEMATILANGGRYNSWDNPDSKSAISEKMGKHLRDVVSPFLRARQPWILQTKRLPDISFLYSATSHYAATDTLPNAFQNGGYMVPVTNKIWEAGLNYEMLPEYKLTEGTIQSKLILVENPAALSESNIKALRKFAESGGTILVTGRGILSENLPELLGIAKPESPLIETDLHVISNKQAYDFKHQLYRVQPREAQILLKAKDSKGLEYSLLTTCRVGKGKAMALLVPLLSEEKGKPYKLPAALIKEILEKAIPSEQRLLVSNTPSHVETVLRKKNNQHIFTWLITLKANGNY
jgi:hypothetical protein